MPAKGREAHWQSIYAATGESEVSWFQDDAQPSLGLIEEIAAPSSAVVDIGGGASRLVDGLLNRGFLDLTILDLSSMALSTAKSASARKPSASNGSRLTSRPGSRRGPMTSGMIARRSTSWSPNLIVQAIFPGWSDPSNRAAMRLSQRSRRMVLKSVAACP